jgi:hypothetical protein
MELTLEALESANERGMRMLHEHLAAKNAILIAGSGSSVCAGYPTWRGMIDEMSALGNPIFTPTAGEPIEALQQIRDQCIRQTGSDGAIYEYVAKRFAPNGRAGTGFHRDLVRLPFAGIATTNYDHVLEAAATAAMGTPTVALNLCNPNTASKQSLFDYQRALGSGMQMRDQVLHIHGSYDLHREIVLTAADYERFYGGRMANAAQDQATTSDPGSLHHRVLQVLMVSRLAVFVGFGLNDAVFNTVLQSVRAGFTLGDRCVHIALSSCSSNEDLARIRRKWESFGVAPVFYPVPEDDPTNHAALHAIVAELAETYAVEAEEPTIVKDPPIEELSSRLLRNF